MGLRDVVIADLNTITRDTVSGFAHKITLIDPEGAENLLEGFSNDIAQAVDPDTGQIVSGRSVSVAISIKQFTEKGLKLPVGIAESVNKPWIVEFNDLCGLPARFKVMQSNPDRSIGLVTCLLEFYK